MSSALWWALWDGSSIRRPPLGIGRRCRYESTPAPGDHHRLPIYSDGCDWLRLSPHRVQGAASVSIRHHMGRTRPSHSDCVWSIHAPRSQLGALACARLDRLPRDPERVPHAIRAGNSHFVLRNPGLFSLPPHRDPLLPGCRSIGEIAAFPLGMQTPETTRFHSATRGTTTRDPRENF